MISTVPDARMRSTNGLGSPKDNITALGRCSSARSIASASICQVRNPMPHGFPAASAMSGSSRASHSGSPFAEPSIPSPPPRDTAAASAPPADPPIGASAIGCCTPSNSVNRVDSPITAFIPFNPLPRTSPSAG